MLIVLKTSNVVTVGAIPECLLLIRRMTMMMDSRLFALHEACLQARQGKHKLNYSAGWAACLPARPSSHDELHF